MSVFRRPAALTAALAAAVALGAAVLGVVPGSSAAATPAAGAASFTPKVPGAATCCNTAYLTRGGVLRSDNPSRSTLDSVGLGLGPDRIAATVSPYYLALEANGDLVEYRIAPDQSRRAVWSAGTRSSTPTQLVFQRDGNVVLSTTAGRVLWSTGTGGTAAAYFDVYGNGQVVTQDAAGRVVSAVGPSSTALPGVEISGSLSPSFVDGRSTVYALSVQTDGNVVVYRRTPGGGVPVWSTGTAGVGPVRLVAQSDGNLVLHQLSTNRVVWASGSHGPTAYYQLDLQDDSNLVLYRTDGVHRLQATWAAGIHR